MTLCTLTLLGVLGAAPARPAAPAEPASSQERGFTEALVAVRGLPLAAVGAELALRLPAIALTTQWDSGGVRKAGDSQVYVAVLGEASGGVRIEVITGDGQGFVRHVPAGGDDVREATAAIASLLLAIEQQEVRADRRDVALPASSAAADVEAATAQLEQDPEPVEPEPAEPEAPEPVVDQPVTAEPADIRSALPDSAAPPGWEVGTTAALGALVGLLAPRYGSLLQGAGISLAATARAPGGTSFGLRLRYFARERDARRIQRFRIALAGGYTYRIGRFELPLLGELGAEPWWIVDDDGRIPSNEIGAPGSGRVVFGAAARLQPGFLIRPNVPRLAAVRLGADLAVGGGFVVDGGARVALVSAEPDPESDPLFRVGGLEVSVGVGATIWFGIGSGSQ